MVLGKCCDPFVGAHVGGVDFDRDNLTRHKCGCCDGQDLYSSTEDLCFYGSVHFFNTSFFLLYFFHVGQ